VTRRAAPSVTATDFASGVANHSRLHSFDGARNAADRRPVDQLATYDGWALSTSRRSLRDVLLLVPGGDLIAKSRGPSNIHEYVIVSPARRRMPGPPDALVAAVARGGDSDLIGRKPLRFVFWVFELLGASPGDALDDLFPGSGVVSRCWEELSRAEALSPRTSATAAPGDWRLGSTR
jgi:hypothetical protein